MAILLEAVLDTHEIHAAREVAANAGFVDGRTTAGSYAREVKANAQASSSPAIKGLIRKVEQALDRHSVFKAAAQPRRIVKMLLSRYEPGQAYGRHVDDAIMAGARTDLSFTLFLSAEESYDGGELIVEDTLEERAIRLPAGDAILYASDTLHRVAPVTRGERLAIVGWVESWVRLPQQRAILFDLDLVLGELFASEGKSEQFDRLAKARSNLLRLWAAG